MMDKYITSIQWDNLVPLNDEGKNSAVFIARDVQLEADLVVKRVSKKSIKEDHGSVEDSSLFSESRILYHPNVKATTKEILSWP